MKTIRFTALSFIIFGISYAQQDLNLNAPNYQLKQTLPDSLRNTRLENLNGKAFTLSEILIKHKGKKILVDIWASWCKDCLISIPKLKILREKLQGKNIVYLLLSVGKDRERWQNTITKFKIEGEHYIFEEGWKNSFNNYIDLDWIPRFLIIDENGKIIHGKSIEVDDKKLFRILSDSN